MSSRIFLKWMFRDWYRDVSTWALLTGVASMILLVALPEAVWPFWTLAASAVTMFADLAWVYVKFNRSMYELEQNEAWRKLKSQATTRNL